MPTSNLKAGCLDRLLNAIALTLVLNAGFRWFSTHYFIGHDSQPVTCLSGSPRWFLIDRAATPGRSGEFLAFRADGRMAPEIPIGTLIVKRIEAEAGSLIEIGENVVRIEGRPQVLPYPHRTRLGSRALLKGSRIRIPEGGYFVLGDHPKSLDSRYYGDIRKEQVIGRARILF